MSLLRFDCHLHRSGAPARAGRLHRAGLPLGAALLALAASAAAPACTGTLGDAPSPEGAATATSSSSGGDTDEPLVPAAGGLRRLVASQYVSSVRLLLGDAAAAAAKPPADPQLHGLSEVAAVELALGDVAVDAYEQSARDVAAAAVKDPAALAAILPCAPTRLDDTTCYEQLAARFGRLAWRRRLSGEETARLAAVGETAAVAFSDTSAAVAAVVSAILQSPNFIYIVEIGDPDPGDGSGRRLTQAELATRMSFFLLDTTPDEALLDLAEAGGVATPDDVRAVARELVQRPAARPALESFYAELFKLDGLAELPKDAELFPQFTPELRSSMRSETLRLIGDIVWDRDADAREMFDAGYTFVDPALASLYGLPAPVSGGFEKVLLPAGQGRGGLLGQASFLARFAHPATTSPTRRGLFVRTMLLCEDVPPPPPGANTTLPDDAPGEHMTMRERLEKHRSNPTCAGCHDQMDPIGLAMENFDPIGAYRTTDEGLLIDPVEDVPDIGKFGSPAELGAVLHGDARAAACLVKQIYRDSMGHLETAGEAGAVRDLVEAFAGGGYRVQDVLVELCASPAFGVVGEPK